MEAAPVKKMKKNSAYRDNSLTQGMFWRFLSGVQGFLRGSWAILKNMASFLKRLFSKRSSLATSSKEMEDSSANDSGESVELEAEKEAALQTLQSEYYISEINDLDDWMSNTPLANAIQIGDKKLFDLLLKAGADPQLPGKDGNTALHHAVLEGELEMVKTLLVHPRMKKMFSQETHLYNQEGNTPLHLAVTHPEVLELLLKIGVIKLDVINIRSQTALHAAVIAGEISAVKTLKAAGANIDVQDSAGYSPLHLAIMEQATDIIEFLLDEGAKVNTKEKSVGRSPLHTAAEQNCADIIDMLVEKEAQINARDNDEDTPLHAASRVYTFEPLATQALLSIEGIDINATNKSGNTPLHEAVRSNLLSDVALKQGFGATSERLC